MQNLNPYNQLEFQTKFKQTHTFSQLDQKYDNIHFDKFFELVEQQRPTYTPRQVYAVGYPTSISAVPWYYLDYLDSSKTVVDLGCGMNFFKPYFPNLIGIDNNYFDKSFAADVDDYVDDDFYQNHVDTYDSVFSINALHFHPLENLRNICLNFTNMLVSGGRGFLTLNAKRMLEKSSSLATLDGENLDKWVRSQFDNFPCKILVFDVDLSVLDAYMDGNIRIVFEK
jgi:hypothetical protein